MFLIQKITIIFLILCSVTSFAANHSKSSKSSRTHKGSITYDDGGHYTGDIRGGKENGKGIVIWTNGNRYEGDFVDGKGTGKGIFIWADGNRYEGDWVDGNRTGKGIFIRTNGNRYEGDWVDGNRTGKGIFIWADDGSRYEGDWVDDSRTGKGIYIWPNGDRYEGDFLDNKITGKGIKIWANGERYEGDFVDDKRTGWGIFTWTDGKRSEGEWLNNSQVQTSNNTAQEDYAKQQEQQSQMDMANTLLNVATAVGSIVANSQSGSTTYTPPPSYQYTPPPVQQVPPASNTQTYQQPHQSYQSTVSQPAYNSQKTGISAESCIRFGNIDSNLGYYENTCSYTIEAKSDCIDKPLQANHDGTYSLIGGQEWTLHSGVKMKYNLTGTFACRGSFRVIACRTGRPYFTSANGSSFNCLL